MSENNNEYVSMMGLIDEDCLASWYKNNSWKKFNNLQEVLKNMKKSELGDEDKHAIPDVYGRVIQFGIALKNIKDHSQAYYNTEEVLEWRGILAAIALQDFLCFPMKTETLNYISSGTAFDNALQYFPDSKICSISNDKGHIPYYFLMIKGEDKPEYEDIAFFSPMTLFFPVADIEDKMPYLAKMSWFDKENKKFLDPAKKLTKTEKQIVWFWISQLKESMILEHQNNEVVFWHLDKFKEDLKSDWINEDWKQKNCFQLLRCRGDLQNNLAEIVFNKTVRVLIDFNGKKISYNELFASKIYYTKAQKSPFVGCAFASKHKVTGTEIGEDEIYALIPLGRKVIDECEQDTVSNLVNCLNMTLVKGRGNTPDLIKVELFLTQISESYIDLVKYYSLEEDCGQSIIESEFPTIAIWPSNNIDKWKMYCVYLEGGNGKKISIGNKGALNGCNPYVKAYNSCPTAIFMIDSSMGHDYDIGMFLPEFQNLVKERPKRANINATVGIDFGTSGTTVYVKRNDNGDAPYTINLFEDKSKLLISNENNNINMNYMSKYFIASNPNKNSLYSVYRRPTRDMLTTVDPILDGIIYQAKEGDMISNSELFMPDIKWENPNNGVYYVAFIEELCMHICKQLQEQGVTNIEWRYALPESLFDKDEIHELWSEYIKSYLEDKMPITQTISQNRYSESEAASVYFLNANEMNRVNRDKGYMVVDIGGGSSDIAVWQRMKDENEITMVTQISVPVAGRILFTRCVALNLDDIIKEVFCTDEGIKGELEKLKTKNATGDNQKICNAILEQMIQNNYKTIKNSYAQNPQWAKNLKTQLEFGVAMLFYSLGSLVGHLQRIGALQTQGIDGSFAIAFGGNGSKILEWVEKDMKKFEDMFKAGIESRVPNSREYEPQIIISKKQKKEVAYGLVQDDIDKIVRGEKDVKEEISNILAVEWNRHFLNNYNRCFGRNVMLEENEIFAIMSSGERCKDICNFFLNDMYMKYYKNRIG